MKMVPARLLAATFICASATVSTSCDRTSSVKSSNPVPQLGTSADELSSIEMEIARITGDLAIASDYRSILSNELQYTRGLDRHDEDLINRSFWPDAEASYGTLVAMKELATWANDSHADYATHQHHVTGLTVDRDEDVAHVESYIIFSSDMKRDSALDTAGDPTPGRVPPGTYASLGTGRYLNRYERRGDRWKIRVHEYAHEISMRLEAVDVCATGCLGRWDRSDISYMRPLAPLSADERRRRIEDGKFPHASNE